MLVETVAVRLPDDSGQVLDLDGFVWHVTTIGTTGVLTIRARDVGAVNELHSELGLG